MKIRITYRKHHCARSIKITVKDATNISVAYPQEISRKQAKAFFLKKTDWILKNLKKIKKRGSGLLVGGSRQDYLKNKERARRLIYAKINYFNQFYNFKYKRLAVRNQKTRWGSCSQGGNLNFSYRIIYLPEKLADYLIVHELCHLQEMNHSKKFWTLVGKTITDYKKTSKELRNK